MTSERLTPAELDAMLADLELGIITRNGSSMFPIYAAAFRELRRLPTMLMEQSTARLRRIHELEAERSMRAEAKCDSCDASTARSATGSRPSFPRRRASRWP